MACTSMILSLLSCLISNPSSNPSSIYAHPSISLCQFQNCCITSPDGGHESWPNIRQQFDIRPVPFLQFIRPSAFLQTMHYSKQANNLLVGDKHPRSLGESTTGDPEPKIKPP
jgi:hypothetical protein